MAYRTWMAVVLTGGLAATATAQSNDKGKGLSPKQQQLLAKIKWQDGPCEAKIGTVATLKVPKGYHFTGSTGAQAYMELAGNPPNSKMLGLIEPMSDKDSWILTFDYDDMGYVKDDEKDKIDADAILSSIKTGTAEANKKRAQMGVTPLDIVGWSKSPFYDSRTNRLTWAILGKSDGEQVVNYNSRILGRGGVMSANMIYNPKDEGATLPEYDKVLTGFGYVSGQQYSDYKSGDKIAEYGLAALIGGGAIAVAAKSGLLAKLIKPIIVGVLVLGGLFAKFFRSIFGGKKTEQQ